MIGTQILHYRIEERLGEGGMGVVYRATDTKLARQVALKFLPAFVSQRPDEKERLLREARTASALDHPNIATIYEINEAEGKLFYAMSLVEGVTLKALRRQGPVTHKQIIQIAAQVAHGLAHAHERGIVHRDIKPQNIMVTTEGRARILDFGLAKIVQEESQRGDASTAGTAAYLSPEQAQGDPATPRSDLFSLGVVLYELTCGEPPFKGEHPAALLYSIVHEDPRPLAERSPDAPPALVAIIERLMSKDPDRRYQTAGELAAELGRLARDLEFSSFSGGVRTLKKDTRFGWRSVILAVLAVGVLGVGTAYLIGENERGAVAADQYDLAVMYFDDLSSSPSEQRIGEMVTELLITDLSGMPDLRVLSSQRLYDILKQLNREGQVVIDRTVASEIARTARARNMVTGSIARSGDRTRLTLNLIEVATGDLLRSEQVEGNDLFAMVDSLSARVQHKIIPIDLSRDRALDLSVAEATTSNPEAYLHYIEGLEAYHRLDWDPALAHFDSAIALDSNFGLAYLRAGIASVNSNRIARGYQYLGFGQRALEQGKLPPIDSLRVATFSALVDNDIQKAIEILRQTTDRFPDDKEAYFFLGNLQSQVGDKQQAIENIRKSLELDPTYPFALLTLINLYQDLDDIPNAISMAERYRTVRPDEATPRLTLGGLYLRVDQFVNARAEFEEARRLAPESYQVASTLASYFGRTGDIDSIRTVLEPFMSDTSQVNIMTAAHALWGAALFLDGRFTDAFAQYRRTAEVERRFGDSLSASGHLVRLATRYLTVGETDSARSAFDQAYRINAKNLKFSDLPFRIALVEGDWDAARIIQDKLIERFAKVVNAENLRQSKLEFEAQLNLAQGRFETALEQLLLIRQLSGDPDDYSFWIGRAHLETGQPAQARQELSHSLVRYEPSHARGYWLYSWYYLGRAHEELGNRGDAEQAYRTFLRYWGRADRKLPEIQDARERLAELGGAS
jgi:serine/threonine protein kinase/tetratricopeptide (TPR) repeat protein